MTVGDGILGRMKTTDVDTLKRAASLAGFDFADADLEPLRPSVARALQALERLEALPLASVEPVTHYRVV